MNIPKNPDERRAWVTYQLRCKNTSLTAIVRQRGVSRQTIYNALMVPSLPSEKAIAEALGLEVSELFPERYTDQGERRGRVRSVKANRKISPPHVQNGAQHEHSGL